MRNNKNKFNEKEIMKWCKNVILILSVNDYEYIELKLWSIIFDKITNVKAFYKSTKSAMTYENLYYMEHIELSWNIYQDELIVKLRWGFQSICFTSSISV